MKEKITKAERLQLVGLLTLAEYHANHIEALKSALIELLDAESERDGHVADAVYDDGRRDADELLKRLGISVSR